MGVAALALHWAGRGPLTAPPLSHPARWTGWLDNRTPVEAAFAVLRLAALAALGYAALATGVGASLRLLGAASLVRAADRVTFGPLRRMLAGSVSLGLAASGVMAAATPVLRVPVAVAQVTTSTSTTVGPPPATVTMHRLSPAEAVTAPAVVPVPEIVPATAGTGDHWTVRPGECFWSIAESLLTDRWGRSPSDAEIVPYWRRLIDANRRELAHADDPDLIFPGQVFVVPAP
jgi:hypothetical protein